MKTTLSSVCLAAGLVAGLWEVSVQATLLGPTYPAPGGNSWSPSGSSAADPGGIIFSYSGFNSASFSELYWGQNQSYPIVAKLSQGGSSMSFDSISGNTAIWKGTGFYVNHSMQPSSTPTMFRATVNSVNTPWVLASSVGLSSSLGAVINDSTGLDYSVTLEFLAWNGSAYIPLNTFDNDYDRGSGSSSSFYGGFYYAEPVPEPTTMIAGALLLLPFGAGLLRRMRQS